MAGIGEAALQAAIGKAGTATEQAAQIATDGSTAVANTAAQLEKALPDSMEALRRNIQDSYDQQVVKDKVTADVNATAGSSTADQQFLSAISTSFTRVAANTQEAQVAAGDTWLTHPINTLVRELTNTRAVDYDYKARVNLEQANTLQSAHVQYNAAIADVIAKKQSMLPIDSAEYKASQLDQLKNAATLAANAAQLQAAPTIMEAHKVAGTLAEESGNQEVANAHLLLSAANEARAAAAQGNDTELHALTITHLKLQIQEATDKQSVIEHTSTLLAGDAGISPVLARAKFNALPRDQQEALVASKMLGQDSVATNSARVAFLTEGQGANPDNPNVSQPEIAMANEVKTAGIKLSLEISNPDGTIKTGAPALASLSILAGLNEKELSKMKPEQLRALVDKVAASQVQTKLESGQDSFVQSIQPGAFLINHPEAAPSGTSTIFAAAKSWNDVGVLTTSMVTTGQWTPQQGASNLREFATNVAGVTDKVGNKARKGLPPTSRVMVVFNMPGLMGADVPTPINAMDSTAVGLALMASKRQEVTRTKSISQLMFPVNP